MAALAAILAALALAACGGSSDSSGSASSEEGGAAETSSPEAKKFLEYTGISEKAAEALKGQEFKFGAILPLSGQGAQYAIQEQNGLLLAVDQMRKYLGLDVNYKALDHKSGDPQAGAAAARQLGIEGFGVAANSYYGVFGSTLPEIQKYKMLSIDAGGGTGNSLKGQEYFWGMRAPTPDAGFPALRYFKKTEPQRKTIALVVWDAGQEYIEPIEEHLKEETDNLGYKYLGTIPSKIGATDYSSVINKLKSMNPDIVWLMVEAADPGYFMKQYVASGLDARIIGSEFSVTAEEIASAENYKEYYYAGDEFNFAEPDNPFSEYFIAEYENKFEETPNIFFEPNYYEAGIAYGVLAARVAEKGGDINSGEELQNALEEDPTLPSVYGGSDNEVGQFVWNTETHDPEKRPIVLAKFGKPAEILAEWNIGGDEFEIVAK